MVTIVEDSLKLYCGKRATYAMIAVLSCVMWGGLERPIETYVVCMAARPGIDCQRSGSRLVILV